MHRGTALVTGASGGFGVPITVALAELGYRVFATVREPDRAAPIHRALAHTGYCIDVVPLDLCDDAARQRAVEHVLTETGAIDVLVNNAGRMLVGFVEDVSDAELREQLDVNFFGLMDLTRRCIPTMRERRHGRIIHISSLGGRVATPGHGAYNASKFALEGIGEAMRAELAPYHVFVSLVEPGLFPTPMFDENGWLAARATERSPHHRALSRLRAQTREFLHHRAAADPGAVARVVARIALSPRPRLRYPVGLDAWWGSALATLVPAWWEGAMTRAFQSP